MPGPSAADRLASRLARLERSVDDGSLDADEAVDGLGALVADLVAELRRTTRRVRRRSRGETTHATPAREGDEGEDR